MSNQTKNNLVIPAILDASPEDAIAAGFGAVDAALIEIEQAHQIKVAEIKAGYVTRLKHFHELRDAKPQAEKLPLTDPERRGYVLWHRFFPDLLVENGNGTDTPDLHAFNNLIGNLFGPAK